MQAHKKSATKIKIDIDTALGYISMKNQIVSNNFPANTLATSPQTII